MELKLRSNDGKKSEQPQKPKFPRAIYLLLAIALILLTTLIVIEEIESPHKIWGSSKPQNITTNEQPEETILITIEENAVCEEIMPPERRNLPEAMIVGVKQGGVELLWKVLNDFPQLKMVQNETRFFSNDIIYSKGLKWYQNSMPATSEGQLTIDVSPDCFTNEQAMQRIKLVNKNTKLIMVLRDPVHRLHSDFTRHTLLQYMPSYNLKFGKGDRNKTFNFPNAVSTGMYSIFYKQWLKYFNASQILLVPYERLIQEPLRELKKIETFLGVSFDDEILKKAAAEEVKKLHQEIHQENSKMNRILKEKFKIFTFHTTHWAFRFMYWPNNMEIMRLTGDQFYRKWF